MANNPYIGILSVIEAMSRSTNTPSVQIGKVIEPPPEVQILYNGIVLTKEDIWISHYLLAGYGREAKGHLVSNTQPKGGGGGEAAYASHAHSIDNDYTDTVVYTDTLRLGMYVAILPMVINDSVQQYVVLDEIVRLDGHG